MRRHRAASRGPFAWPAIVAFVTVVSCASPEPTPGPLNPAVPPVEVASNKTDPKPGDVEISLKITSHPDGAQIFSGANADHLAPTGFSTPHTFTKLGPEPFWAERWYSVRAEGFRESRTRLEQQEIGANASIHLIMQAVALTTIGLKVTSDPPGARIQFRPTETSPLNDTGFATPHTLTMTAYDPYWLPNYYVLSKDGYLTESVWFAGTQVNTNGELHVKLRPVATPTASATPPTPPAASEPVASDGTAFLVSDGGYFITNYHVVADGAKHSVLGADGMWHSASLIGVDRNTDLALLRCAATGITTPVEFAVGLPRLGEQVVVIGFPLQGVLSSGGVVTSGIISADRGMNDNPQEMQVNAEIQPGNSGAPVFDEQGRVVGVAYSTMNPFFLAQHEGALPQNVNFAVKASAVRNLLDSWRVPFRSGADGVALSVADIAEKRRAAVTRVRSEK